MRSTCQRFIEIFFLLIILSFASTLVVKGQPRIIDISPGVPAPLTTIEFTVSDFRSSNVENVTLYVQERSNETNYENISYPMIGNQYQEYRTNVTLTHEDTTYTQKHELKPCHCICFLIFIVSKHLHLFTGYYSLICCNQGGL